MDAYLELMYRLWGEWRAKTLPHLRKMAAIPIPVIPCEELLGKEHYDIMRLDYEEIVERGRTIIERPDRYERLLLDLDIHFLDFYARFMNGPRR